MKPSFRPSSRVISAARPTSDPVPAVVGMAITGATAAGPFQRTDNMVSGRAGLIWQPADSQSYYVSFANSYNPSGELGVYAGTAQTNLNAVNQNLDPEENRNYEIGTNLTVAQGLQLRSAIFRTEKINQRINNSITGVTELAGKRRVEGIEFEFTGSITPNWDIYSGVAFMNGEIVSATVNQGNTPLGVPDWSGNVWTVYRLGGGWEVGGGVVATSGSYLTDQNNAKIPEYAVLDATVAYIQKKYEVRATFYNITDKHYYLAGYQNASNRVIPGMPRAASLTLRYNFD
jgi:catecholate siderophore receptor